MSLTSRPDRRARSAWRALQHGARAVARGATLVVAFTALFAVACGRAADDTPGAAATARVAPMPSPITASATHAVAPAETATPGGFGSSIGFRSRQRLDEHYSKHGAEFGSITRDDYLRRAQALRDAPVSGSVLEMTRGDGAVSRFDRASGAFLAFGPDGIIRTFFRPTDGERYFRRQAVRRRTP